MSVNRYDQPVGQRYVSTYVPLPFEALSDMAAKREDQSNKLLDATDKARGLLNIKADPKNVAYRDKLQKQFNDQLTSVSEKIVKEGYTPENRSLVSQTINSIVNSPERMELEKSYQHYGEYQKDAQKNQQDRKYWDKYDPYETGPKGSEAKVTPFTYQGMKTKGDYLPDMQGLIDHIAKDEGASEGYKKEGGKLVINEQGQIQKSDNSWENITESKVYKLAQTLAPTFFRSKDANWFIDERLGYNSGKSYSDLNTEKNIEIPVQESYKDPKTGKQAVRTVNKKFSERELLEEEATKEMFRIGSPQIFSSYKQGVDLQNLSEHALRKRDALAGLPQTAPDTQNIEDITKEIPENIKDFVSYNKQPDGTYAVKINLDNLGKDLPIYGPNAILMGTKPGDVKGDTKRILDYLYNAAKSIGYGGDPEKGISYDPKKVTVANAQDILSQYLEYSKNISPQEILDGPIQKVLSNNILNDRQNFTIRGADGVVVTDEDQAVMKGFKVNSRTYKDGKQVIKGGYFDEDENYHPVTVIPHSNQSNNYFNTVGAIKQSTYNFFKSGEVKEDDQKAITNFAKATGIKFDAPGFKGLKPINIKPIPGQPSQYMITMSDKENRKDIKMYVVDLSTGTRSEVPGGLDGAMQYISTSWYTNTPEGGREALQLTNAKGQYEGITEGQ